MAWHEGPPGSTSAARTQGVPQEPGRPRPSRSRNRKGSPDHNPRPAGGVSGPAGAKTGDGIGTARRGKTEGEREDGQGVGTSSDVPKKRGNQPKGPRGGKVEVRSWNRRRETRRAHRRPAPCPRNFDG